jgi:membrane-bound lytic murein transglycosylase D
LRRETRNFVPAILAVTILAKSPSAYGFTEETDFPLVYDTLTVQVATDLRVIADAAGLSLGKLTELNPALLYGQTPPNCAYVVRLPVGTREVASSELEKIPPEDRLVFHRHKIRKGDTLWDLARQYGTSVRAIQAENGLGRSTLLRVGRMLRIPNRLSKDLARKGSKEASKDKPLDTAPPSFASALGLYQENAEPDLGRGPSTAHVIEEARLAIAEAERNGDDKIAGAGSRQRIHIVQRGDTLYDIARRYGVSLSRIYRLNDLGPRSVIRPGQKVITHK